MRFCTYLVQNNNTVIQKSPLCTDALEDKSKTQHFPAIFFNSPAVRHAVHLAVSDASRCSEQYLWFLLHVENRQYASPSIQKTVIITTRQENCSSLLP